MFPVDAYPLLNAEFVRLDRKDDWRDVVVLASAILTLRRPARRILATHQEERLDEHDHLDLGPNDVSLVRWVEHHVSLLDHFCRQLPSPEYLASVEVALFQLAVRSMTPIVSRLMPYTQPKGSTPATRTSPQEIHSLLTCSTLVVVCLGMLRLPFNSAATPVNVLSSSSSEISSSRSSYSLSSSDTGLFGGIAYESARARPPMTVASRRVEPVRSIMSNLARPDVEIALDNDNQRRKRWPTRRGANCRNGQFEQMGQHSLGIWTPKKWDKADDGYAR